jgi:glutamate/tyrosine decarboxylase-like PLP-dependent enzyme/quercetin dioxygenase-like cupin family protein
MVKATSQSPYLRKILYQSEAFEVVQIQWAEGQGSPVHGHGWSQCMVLVEDGLFENTLDMGFKTEVRRVEQGQVVSTPVGGEHTMRCLSPTGTTLHVYAPPLTAKESHGVFHSSSAAPLESDLRVSQPVSIEELIKLLESLRARAISTDSPFFMNQLFSGVLPQMVLAENLITQTRTTLATYEASPAFSAIEAEVVDALGAIIGWPKGARDGVTVPGGSAANFMALHCARQRKVPGYRESGMQGQRFHIYLSNEAHYSFKKACIALGFGTNSLVHIGVDEKGRMRPEELEKAIRTSLDQGEIPLMVAATAGTTVLGAFDPLEPLADLCERHQVWLHVDGAWGGPAVFSKRVRSLVRGIERADSVAFDAHKLFGASLTCSFLLTKHAGLLLAANDVSGAEYLFHSDDPTADRGKLSWQCGRRADAVSFWAIWKSLGTEGMGQCTDGLLEIRDQVLAWAETQPRLQLVAKPDFLNVCYRIAPPAGRGHDPQWSKHVRETLKMRDLALVNYSANADGSFLRLILAHPFLKFEHVRQILEWSLEVE